MSKVVSKTNFDFIRYANCWEDSDILRKGLQIKEGDNCLSICSAGDNALSLLIDKPSKVVAVDLNDAQIACLELRMAAFKELEYEDVLKFLGIDKSSNRIEVYALLKKDLSDTSMRFWDERLDLIKKGVIHAGKLETFFKMLRRLLGFAHFNKDKKIKNLIAKSDIKKQKQYYKDVWNNKRWRLLIKFMYSNTMLGHVGRDPNFYKYVEGSMSEFMLQRNDAVFTEVPAYSNPYLNYILTGNFTKQALPTYLRKENFLPIKNGLNKVTIYKGDLLKYLDENKDMKFHAMNLSNIFEYMDEKEFHDAFERLLNACDKGARIAYYNAFVDRIVPRELSFKTDEVLSEQLYRKAGAFFYKRFIVGSSF